MDTHESVGVSAIINLVRAKNGRISVPAVLYCHDDSMYVHIWNHDM